MKKIYQKINSFHVSTVLSIRTYIDFQKKLNEMEFCCQFHFCVLPRLLDNDEDIRSQTGQTSNI